MAHRFLHSGKYGDLIYALWTIKALGGGEIWFNLTQGSLANAEAVRFCTPLLKSLDYISGVHSIVLRPELSNHRGEKLFCRQDVNNPDFLILDNAWYWRNWPETYHWISRYAYAFGAQKEVDASQPVIHLDRQKMAWEDRPIVMHLTQHLRSRSDEYYEPLSHRRKEIKVIREGSHETLLQVAELIANAKFFIGNQSMGNALAQAIGIPRLCEMPEERFFYDAYPIGPTGKQLTDSLDVEIERVLDVSRKYWSDVQRVYSSD
jgi:hypothetical protein